ncbi:hypothetical protein TNCV_3310951 [Trichonephila clavipes]|nr:hypothetical protein TNCV_3310951 [Trichonephila clavipes]
MKPHPTTVRTKTTIKKVKSLILKVNPPTRRLIVSKLGMHSDTCNAQQLFHVRPKVTGKSKIRDIWGISVAWFGKHLCETLGQFVSKNSYGVIRITIRVLSYSTTAAQENQRPCSKKKMVYNGIAKSVRFHILHGLHSVFSYPNNRVSEQCPFPIASNKRLYRVSQDYWDKL